MRHNHNFKGDSRDDYVYISNFENQYDNFVCKRVLASFEGISFEGIFTDNFLSALLLKPFQSQMERQRLALTFESVDSTVVIKSRGPGISPGYYECGPWVLLLKNRRKIEPNEIHSCLIPCLLNSISYLEHCTHYNMGLCY